MIISQIGISQIVSSHSNLISDNYLEEFYDFLSSKSEYSKSGRI